MLQDGWLQCPVCGKVLSSYEYELYGICNACEQDYAQSPEEWEVNPLTGKVIKKYDEQLDVERMEDEGGPPAGEKIDD